MGEIKRVLKVVRNAWVLLPIVSWLQIRHFLFFSKGQPDRLYNADTFPVKVTACNDMRILLRCQSAVDRDVFRYVFYNQYHLPPVNLPQDATILDLGANIGLTMRHYNYLYPNARIIGYEMDMNNFAVAQQNCNESNQLTIINAAVWKVNEVIQYQTHAQEDAYQIDISAAPNAKTATAIAVSIGDILKQHHLDRIHFIKMDIEGAEKDILQFPDHTWMKKIGSINVEIHDTDFFQEAMQILIREGFECKKDHRHWSAILAVKPGFFNE